MRWLTVLLCVSAAAAQEPDLGDASLEQLLQIRVSSASKKIQPLSQVPAAMHVITQDDIRRSGATSLLDILRWVPGLEVAQIDANKWAISSRGFNTRFANKMLVLMDGRSLYGVDFGGIFWDVLDTFLEDVERIEVIRGPGATMWGANAVNGVINIITKHSRETKGSIVQAGGGNRDFGTAQARFGFAAGKSGYARVYAKHVNRGAFPMDNTIGDDRWNSTLGGFRSDWDLGRADRLTVQGDLYRNQRQLNTFLVSLHPPFQVNSGAGGAHGVSTQARWTHTHQNLSQTAVQFYAEGHSHDDGLVLQERSTLDWSLQRQQFIGNRHDVQYGAGYRTNYVNMPGTLTLTFSPQTMRHNLTTAFVQDEVQLIEGVLSAVVGMEVERNPFTGWEIQPTARLYWTPSAATIFWTSISRAVRTPSMVDRFMDLTYAVFPSQGGNLMGIGSYANGTAGSEDLRAQEAGWRSQWNRRVSTDLALFYNVYSKLRTEEPAAPILRSDLRPPVLMFATRPNGLGSGESYGAEFSTRVQITPSWRLTTGYTYFKMNLHLGKSHDTEFENNEGRSPRHRGFLQSSWNLPHRWQLDATAGRTGRLFDTPAYTRVDGRLSWSATSHWTFSLSGQNLIGPPHVEFDGAGGDTSRGRTLLTRMVSGQITWNF